VHFALTVLVAMVCLGYLDGRTFNDNSRRPQFQEGKLDLPKLHEPPPELLQLLTGTDDLAKNFHKDICRYNNALAMTSLGCKTDNSVNQGAGPLVFASPVQSGFLPQNGKL